MEGAFYEPRRAGRARLQRRGADALRQAPGGRGAAAGRRPSSPRSGRCCGAMAEFLMPILGADMSAGTLVAWRKQPGDARQARRHRRRGRDRQGRDRGRDLHDGVLEKHPRRSRARRCPVGTRAGHHPGRRRRPGPAPAARRRRRRSRRRPRRRTGAGGRADRAAAGRPSRDLAAGAEARAPSSASIPPRCAGTGPGGAITREDVERAAARAAAPAAAAPARPRRPAGAAAAGDRRRHGALQARDPALLPRARRSTCTGR